MPNLPTYSFLPWARQGLAVNINENDTLAAGNGTAAERAELTANLDLKYKSLDNIETVSPISKTIKIVGPGDVTGIHTNAIVRVQPKNGVTNFEENGLAYAEFYEEDFLWRYTPAAATTADSSTKLRPWLALIALQESEFKLTPNSLGLPYITIEQSAFDAAFHHEADAWAFGHVHFNHELQHLTNGPLQDEINAELKAAPDVAVSRLLCPRKLQKNTAYTCFLIPAFETGRLGGLGVATTGVAAQTPAWKKGAMPASAQRPFDFPVYYQWWFRTGNYGDFESLATILKPIIIDNEQGKMPMDIQDPGFNLETQPTGTAVIGFEAALKPVDMIKDPWPGTGEANAEDTATIAELKKLLSLSSDFVNAANVIASDKTFFNATVADDPILVPPVYGVWHALVNNLDNAANPDWVKELNLDFRNRAAAGIGTTIVQQKQENLMARAWQQVDSVNEANKKIEAAQLAKLITGAIMKKNMINAGRDKSFMLTNAVQHLIINPEKTQTVQQDFIESRIPNASKTAAFRKITRPQNKTAVAFKTKFSAAVLPLLVNANTVIGRFNLNEKTDGDAVTGARLRQPPLGALTLEKVSTVISQAIATYENDPKNIAVNALVNIIKEHIINANASLNKAQLQHQADAIVGMTPAAKGVLTDFIANITAEPVAVAGNQVNVTIAHPFFETQFGKGIEKKAIDNILLKDSTANGSGINALASLADVKAIQSNFTAFSAKVSALPQQKVLPAFANLEITSEYLYAKLSPELTFASKLAASIRVWKGGVYVPLRKLKPVMAHPEFEEAVYEYLLNLSKNYILPNIDKIPNNSITLLQNNQSFIEAAMAGLNHEMARELLWREYPTDQRGTYFRQFWNVADNITIESVDPKKEKEEKLDIKKLHEWDKSLGGNAVRAKSDNLVLVIRGDLLKKYPNTVVYAQKAEYDAPPTKPRKLKGDIGGKELKFPIFKADIEPDITLFGFDLEAPEARGERIEDPSEAPGGKNAGWFFVLKERPGQVNFGMDDFTDDQGNDTVMPAAGVRPDDWNDLAWEYLVNTKADLTTYHLAFSKTININNSAGQPAWGSNAADMASILLQDPALLARHAAEMLPEA